MKLGGWYRLWVVVSIAYLALAGIYVFVNWPTPEKIPHDPEFYRQLSPEFRKTIVNTDRVKQEPNEAVIGVEMPNGHVIPFFRKYDETKLEKVASEYWRIVDEKAREGRSTLLAKALFCWLIPCLLVYVLGWSVGWVYRGFKAK